MRRSPRGSRGALRYGRRFIDTLTRNSPERQASPRSVGRMERRRRERGRKWSPSVVVGRGSRGTAVGVHAGGYEVDIKDG